MTSAAVRLDMWGGVECTVNRVGNRWFDQLKWSGHDRRATDLEAFAGLGITALRYPVLWERLAPDDPASIDWRWADERLTQLRDLGIRPIVGLLHHGSGPRYTSLLDPAFPELFTRYAQAVAARYPWIIDFTPINEPLTTARFSALYGHWYPHERSDASFIRALVHQLRGIVGAMQAIRRINSAARLIQTEDCGRTFGTVAMGPQVEHESHRRWLTWDLLAGRVTDDHPLREFLSSSGFTEDDGAFFREHACVPDVLGLNYYVTSDRYLDERLNRYPASTHGGNVRMRYADVEAVRARPEGIVGHEAHLMDAWKRYGRPVALTEVHIGCSCQEQLRWLRESWIGAEGARAHGADVRAVTAWALLGSFNWNTLVVRDAAHYEPGAFDVHGGELRRTPIADAIRVLAAGREIQQPAASGFGWWRRPDRLLDHRPADAGQRKSLHQERTATNNELRCASR